MGLDRQKLVRKWSTRSKSNGTCLWNPATLHRCNNPAKLSELLGSVDYYQVTGGINIPEVIERT